MAVVVAGAEAAVNQEVSEPQTGPVHEVPALRNARGGPGSIDLSRDMYPVQEGGAIHPPSLHPPRNDERRLLTLRRMREAGTYYLSLSARARARRNVSALLKDPRRWVVIHRSVRIMYCPNLISPTSALTVFSHFMSSTFTNRNSNLEKLHNPYSERTKREISERKGHGIEEV